MQFPPAFAQATPRSPLKRNHKKPRCPDKNERRLLSCLCRHGSVNKLKSGKIQIPSTPSKLKGCFEHHIVSLFRVRSCWVAYKENQRKTEAMLGGSPTLKQNTHAAHKNQTFKSKPTIQHINSVLLAKPGITVRWISSKVGMSKPFGGTNGFAQFTKVPFGMANPAGWFEQRVSPIQTKIQALRPRGCGTPGARFHCPFLEIKAGSQGNQGLHGF